jgi:hypothetical protein
MVQIFIDHIDVFKERQENYSRGYTNGLNFSMSCIYANVGYFAQEKHEKDYLYRQMQINHFESKDLDMRITHIIESLVDRTPYFACREDDVFIRDELVLQSSNFANIQNFKEKFMFKLDVPIQVGNRMYAIPLESQSGSDKIDSPRQCY